MKVSNLMVAFLMLLPPLTPLYAQNTIQIPSGTAPLIDGILHPVEWSDAGSVDITIDANTSVEVLYMHDGVNLYFAFRGDLESMNPKFPEILIDVNHDRANSWQQDDWWFHVSATDCEYRGSPAVYDSCDANRPHWKAEHNFSPGGDETDTVEIMIPFSLLEMDPNQTDTFGISFEVTNTFSSWYYWPQTADINDPSGWGQAVLSKASSIEDSSPGGMVHVYPNPVSDYINVVFERRAVADRVDISLYDATGRQIYDRVDVMITGGSHTIPAGSLQPGIYFLVIRQADKIRYEKILLPDTFN